MSDDDRCPGCGGSHGKEAHEMGSEAVALARDIMRLLVNRRQPVVHAAVGLVTAGVVAASDDQSDAEASIDHAYRLGVEDFEQWSAVRARRGVS